MAFVDEKVLFLQEPHSRISKHPTESQRIKPKIPFHRWLVSILAATIVLAVTIYTKSPWWDIDNSAEQLEPGFDWNQLTPSCDLEYVKCYEKFYCARLEVPLDWNSTDSNSKRTVLAVIKRPAEVDVTHESYGGAILLNPGGPGGSGVDFMRLYGETLGLILNTDLTGPEIDPSSNTTQRYYDLISWDPRLVGNTIPKLQDFADESSYIVSLLRWMELAGSLEYPEIFNRAFDLAGLSGKLASSPQPGYSNEEHPGRFAGTTSVVRDMVELIEKHGQWRQRAADKFLALEGRSLAQSEVDQIRQRTAYQKGREMLQYWGFSYGTIVGQTFASMYPERVGRLVIDGVVNATDYYSGDWKTDLIDSENINKNFTLECEAAGPDLCPFAKLTFNTSETLIDGFTKTIAATKAIPITDLIEGSPVYVTDFFVTALIFSAWYSGYFGYDAVGKMLWNVANRNASYFYIPPTNESIVPWIPRDTAQIAISCIDAPYRLNETREEHYDYVQYLHKQSPNFGYAISRITMPCHTYDLRPEWRFDRPFGGKTANPILILSQTLDPITPLISAKGAAKLFPGSQIVEAQGIGHTTLGWPSLCATKELKKYFNTGKVPKAYTYCPASVKPFSSLQDIVQYTDSLPLEDRYLMASALKIAENFPPGNKAFEYGDQDKLPGQEAGDWWFEEKSHRVTN